MSQYHLPFCQKCGLVDPLNALKTVVFSKNLNKILLTPYHNQSSL